MISFSFTALDQWVEFHQFRSGPPPGDLEDLISWIHAMHVPGPYDDVIAEGFNTVMRHHRGGNERWLGISGPAHLGKTRAVTHVLMERAMSDPSGWRKRRPKGGLHTPYIYVEAASNQEARGLFASIARACGLPDEGSEKDLHRMLTAMFPELGVRLVVVDDAQMFRRRSETASRVTDGLRVAVHLPAPFAFVGVDLLSSALLYRTTRNNDTALQLDRRHLPLSLRPLSPRAPIEVGRLIANFAAKVALIDDLNLSNTFRNEKLLTLIAKKSEGRPGSILEGLKRAAVDAVAINNGNLSEEVVAAQFPTSPAVIVEV